LRACTESSGSSFSTRSPFFYAGNANREIDCVGGLPAAAPLSKG
jgi:hypothetical protein